MSATTDKLNRIYENYHDYVDGLHNLLWQVMVNEACKGKTVAFLGLPSDPHQIVIADADGGYIETPCRIDEREDRESVQEIIEALNRNVFDIDNLQAAAIVGRSMR